jgi:hypothetical protein
MKLTATVNEVEVSLYLAHKLERMGRTDEAEWPAFVIPHQAQEDWQTALDLVDHIVKRLRDRGVDVVVTNRPTPNGTVVILTLPPAPGSQNALSEA